MQTIGLVGVGFVGKRFADALTDADAVADEGGSLTVYDVDETKLEYALEHGASVGSSPADVATAADVVILALPGADEVQATVEGEEGILEAPSPPKLVVDTSTTGPETARRCERLCDEAGVGFVSAPFTRNGPRPGVHFLVGATPDRYERAEALLETLGVAHERIGSPAEAQTFKLMLQLRYAGRLAVDAEVVAFGRDNGLEPRLLNEFLGMDVDERLLEGDFSPAIEGLGGLAIWEKDVGYALEVARRRGTAAPLSSQIHEIYRGARRRAGLEEGHAATIATHWQLLNGDSDERPRDENGK